jgi:hypothetical protein
MVAVTIASFPPPPTMMTAILALIALAFALSWTRIGRQGGGRARHDASHLLGGLDHLLPSFFCFSWKHFPFIASHLTKNWTDEQQTASNFLTPWKLPPPMISKFGSLSSGAGRLIH